ncbi:hypothetical protein [Rhodoflexus sp.]
MNKKNQKTFILGAIIVLLMLAGYTALASKPKNPSSSPFNPLPPSPPSGGGTFSGGTSGGSTSGGIVGTPTTEIGQVASWQGTGCQGHYRTREEYVRALQRFLNSDPRFFGTTRLVVDGVYGRLTDAASNRAMHALGIDAGQLACKVAFFDGKITLPLPY